jgi:DNA repair exonuclease SbcCD ATPase subunit
MYFNDSEHNSECSVSISKDSNCDSFEQKEEIYDVQFSTVDTERIEPEESFGSDGMEDNTEHVESVRSDLKFDEFLQGFQVIIKQNQELTDEIRQLVPYKEQVKFIETSEKKTKEEYFKLRAENETLKEQNVRNDEKYKYLEAEQKTLKQQIEELKNQNKKLEDQNKDYLDKLLKKNSIFSWFAK